MKEFDALIIGAGPAGASCALGLAKRGWKIAIIDKSIFPRHKTCGGFIGPENKSFLSDLGIWSELLKEGACGLKESLLTSSRGASTVIRLKSEALGVSRKLLDALLFNRVKAMGIEVYEGAQARNIYNNNRGFEVTVDHYGNNQLFNLHARHVIDASGQCAPSVKLRKIQFGIAAMYQGIPQAFKRVMLHCCEGGHVGINPFEGNQVNICYVVDSAYFKSHGQDPDKILSGWIKENPYLQDAMATAIRVSAWKAVQIPVRHSIVHYENGIWRVGNAAAFIDTATGGGISVALLSGQLLAQSITGFNNDRERLRDYSKVYQKCFSGQRRLAALFGEYAHYPWAANLIIHFLDLNTSFRSEAMNFSRPGRVAHSDLNYTKGALSEV